MKNLKITIFADPVCTWCWGSSPVVRALEYRLGDKVEVNYVMGCMIDDITTFSNRRLGIGGDIALSNRNMHKAWVEASAVHGMAVCESGFRLFTEEHRSTAPQNIAFIAATVYKHKVGGDSLCPMRFLRRLQEATAVDALHTCDIDVLADIAAVEGYDAGRFKELMQSREVARAFDDDRALCRRYDVHTFPTYLIEYKGTEAMLRGFTSFETIIQNISHITYGKVALSEGGDFAPTAHNVARFIERYGSVYPVEVATAFCMQRVSGKSAINVESYVGLPDIVEELIAQGEVAMRPRGNGFMLYHKHHKEFHSLTIDEIVAKEGA